MAKRFTDLDVGTTTTGTEIAAAVQGGILKQFALSLIQKINFMSAGSQVALRGGINLISGSSIQVDVVDNSGSGRVDVTISSTATPNNDPATKIFKNNMFQ